MNKFSNKLLEWLYPVKCPVCDEIFPHGQGLVICPSCYLELHVIQGKTCGICGAPIGNNIKCSNCSGKFYFSSNISAFVYNKALRKIIHDIKYRKKSFKAVSMATLMAEVLSEQLDKYKDFDLILPVPLHKARLRERGYNQASILAEQIAISTGVIMDDNICIRTVDSAKQSLLSVSERTANTEGIFTLKNVNGLSGKKIIAVDDIFTTGSTLNSFARMLKENGAETVACITLCASTIENHVD